MGQPKGNIPWNKGKKGLQKAPPTAFKKGQHFSRRTEFKKGLTPWNKGLSQSAETKEKIRLTKLKNNNSYKRLVGELNPMWKGDEISYRQKHRRIRNILGCPIVCTNCKVYISFTKHKHPNIEWANISGEYSLDLDDWVALCTKCHARFDGIVNNFKK